MKRYDISAECSACGNITKDVIESPYGEWVGWEDVQALNAELLEALQDFVDACDSGRDEHEVFFDEYVKASIAIGKATEE